MKKIVCLLMALAMTAAVFAGCKSEGGSGSKGSFEYKDLGGRTIKIFSQNQIDPRKNPSSETDPRHAESVAHWETIEEKFNCKIDCISSESFTEFQNGYVTAVGAGSVISDVIYGDATMAYPTWMVSGLLDPVDGLYDYKNESGTSPWDEKYQNFYYNGKCYGILQREASLPTWALLFNKRIFSQYEQLKGYDMYSMVENKEWTFDKFREIARNATIDENGDGKPEIMGVATMGRPSSYLNNSLVPSNGCFFVKTEGDKVVFDLGSPEGLEAMQLTYDMAYTDKSLGFDGDFDDPGMHAASQFKAGKVAIFSLGLGNIPEYTEALKNDQFGLLPIPIGPKAPNGDYVNQVALFNFWGVVPGSQNQEDTANVITALVSTLEGEKAYDVKSAWEKHFFDEESLEILEMMVKNPTYCAYYGYHVMIENVCWSDYGLTFGLTPAAFVEECRNLVQDGIDTAWTPRT